MNSLAGSSLPRAASARLLMIVAVLVAAVAGLVLPLSAQAAGSPNLSVVVDVPSKTLFGTDSPVSVRATNPGGQPYGYNLSYRVVLPAGTSYVAGSAGTAGAPRVVANQPVAGQTTLIWVNVSDLSPNSTGSLDFKVRHSTVTRSAGDTLSIGGGVYVADQARYLPKFDAVTGVPFGPSATSFTGFASGSGSTLLTPIELTKSEPSPEGEILRGLHDHQTIYTLKVKNNGVNPTTALSLEDYLPAGLEFLGCATANDNTTDAPTNPGSTQEYPGSGAINVGAVSDCVSPTSVETVQLDPDGAGPLASGIYTHVTWSNVAANLAPSAEFTLKYRAAVPLRENTLTWTTAGGAPTPASGDQATNLDNNDGPETTDEQQLRNGARASATYLGLPVTDEDDITRTAEDLAVQKSVDSGALNQGQTNNWTLDIQASEYRFSDNVVVTDTVPDGQCPIGPLNYSNAGADPECDPAGGVGPTAPHVYSSASENANGTYTVVFDASNNPDLARLQRNGTIQIKFPTRTRSTYREGFANAGPILAADSVTNNVSLAATSNIICTPGPAFDCTGGGKTPIDTDQPVRPVTDASEASQKASLPTLDKRVANNSASCDDDGRYVETIPLYKPGDRICWKLRVDFPSNLDTRDVSLNDYLPDSARFDAASVLAGPNLVLGNGQTPTTAETVGATTFTDVDSGAAGGSLQWTIDGGGLVSGAQIFERVIATRAVLATGAQPGDISGNLFKTSVVNTPGVSTALRDQSDYALATPALAIAKAIMTRNGANTNGTTGVTTLSNTRGGDVLTYRVRTSNTGNTAAENTEVWDKLPTGIVCADISAISNSGACDAGTNTIKWGPPTLLTVPAAGQLDLTYTLTAPTSIQPSQPFINTVGVRTYTTPINTGGDYRYVPLTNIDPTAAATYPVGPTTSSVPDLKATARFNAQGLAITKSHTTSVTQGGNTAQNATIGEIITYTVTATIPKGTTTSDLQLVDPSIPDARQPYVPGSGSATLNGTGLPTGGLSFSDGGGTPIVSFPASYASSTGADDVVVMTFQTQVAQTAANVTGGTLTNTGRLTYTAPSGGTASPINSTPNTTALVEPRIVVAKANNHPTPVKGDDVVVYTLNLSNTGTSPAYDTTLVDVIPAGVTPTRADGTTDLTDGETYAGGTWNLAARTLTFAPAATINDGAAAAVFTYTVRVNNPALGGSALTNNVAATTTSLAGATAGERTSTNDPALPGPTRYASKATNTLTVDKASITKAASPTTATIGTPVTYTVNVTIPAQVELYDTTVFDSLPDSLDFDGYLTATCTSGCAGPLTIGNYTPVVTAGGTALAWDLGDLPSQATARNVQFTYAAHVRATHSNGGANVVDGQNVINAASVKSNTTDKLGGFTPGTIPGGVFDNTNSATATIPVREPAPVLDKKLAVNVGPATQVDGPVDVQVGQTLTYTVRVSNTGTSPLYDVTVEDLPDAELTNVTLAAGVSTTTNTDAWTAGDPDLRWLIPGPIAPGANVLLQYTASLVPVAGLTNNQNIDNTAKLISSYGVSATDRAANPTWTFRPYTAADDSAKAIVKLPNITVVKTPDAGTAVAGSTVNYSIVVSNTAAVGIGATDVIVTDTLPTNTATTYTAGTATAVPALGFSETSATATTAVWRIASLAGGASVTITVPIKTNPAAPVAENVVNSASAVATENPAVKTDTGNVTLTQSADLVASKSASPNPATAGQNVVYTIGTTNNGPSTAVNVRMTDPLPAGVTFVSASAGCTPVTLAGVTTVTCTVGTLAPTASASRTITTTVDAGFVGNVNNTVTTATDTAEPTGNNTATVVVPVAASSGLSLTKDALQPTVLRGQEAKFRVTVLNGGPSTATLVQVTDTLPAGLAYVSDDSGCTIVGQVLTCAIGTMAPIPAASGTKIIEITVRGTNLGAQLNTASIDPNPADSTPLDNTDDATITVLPAADLALVKTADATVIAGGVLTYTLALTNNGPDAATNPKISDPLPAGTTLSSATPGCTLAGGTVTCTQATLPSGDTTTFEIKVNVPVALGAKTLLNTAVASADEGDPTPADNTDSVTTTVGPAADLEVIKTAPATVSAGGTLTWTVVVRNLGPSTATAVKLTDPLPSGVTYVAATPAQGTCSQSTGTVSCELGDLAAGAATQLTIAVMVPEALATSVITNTAEVTATEPDVDPSNNTSTAKTTIDALPVKTASISIVKTADGPATYGRALSYTLKVSNAGPADAPDTVVTDALAASVRFQSATSDQGTCAQKDGIVTCQVGTVKNGQTVLVRVTVIPLAPGDLVNNATVASPASDKAANDNVSRAVLSVRVDRTTLTLKKVASVKRARPGQRFSYALRVKNTGKNSAVNVKVCDTLPRTLALRSVKGGKLKGSQLCFTVARLKAGATKVFTVKVRVNAVVGAASILNRAKVTAANAKSASASARTPLSKVAGTRVTGVTG